MSDTEIKKMNRREFLAYMMAGSMGLLGIQTTGIALWYAVPIHYQQNIFVIKPVPTSLSRFSPTNMRSDTTKLSVPFWLSYSASGMVALHKECPARRCLYAWVNNNGRFECPCSGSKFELDGTYIEGPSPRSLDRYELKVITKHRIYETNEIGDPIRVSLNNIEEIHVNVGKLIQRGSRG